jgi:hypothetical protein
MAFGMSFYLRYWALYLASKYFSVINYNVFALEEILAKPLILTTRAEHNYQSVTCQRYISK